MSEFIPWDSQPYDDWCAKHAPGQFVDLDGHRTHYVEKGSGLPLLLVHGFNFDHETWLANIDALAGHLANYDQSAKFNELVAGFLAGDHG